MAFSRVQLSVAIIFLAACLQVQGHSEVETSLGMSLPQRKLLHEGAASSLVQTNCRPGEDLTVVQGQTPHLPNGIPAFTVMISNTCQTGCNISNIHLHCGWFSSAILVNPKIFRRLAFDDCLVNDGQPLKSGSTLQFRYANSRSYPLSISSMRCG
ncbi:hypothetical protein RJ641_013321 [Dillenia turbinata]|uniref:TPD1 protein homolog 1-like n=1 Tax=Dillenia turbinata TaxID=194707 RepID=A0AAN8WGX8_9MAGN